MELEKNIADDKKSPLNIVAELEVVIMKDHDYLVAYCPSLELSGYGKTEADALSSFEVELKIFLEETGKKMTLEKELLRLGWTLSRAKFSPPKSPRKNIEPKRIERILKERITFPSYGFVQA